MKPDETGPRKPYVKPQLTRVTLRPEEAVLAACKNRGRRGPRPAHMHVSGGRASTRRRDATSAPDVATWLER